MRVTTVLCRRRPLRRSHRARPDGTGALGNDGGHGRARGPADARRGAGCRHRHWRQRRRRDPRGALRPPHERRRLRTAGVAARGRDDVLLDALPRPFVGWRRPAAAPTSVRPSASSSPTRPGTTRSAPGRGRSASAASRGSADTPPDGSGERPVGHEPALIEPAHTGDALVVTVVVDQRDSRRLCGRCDQKIRRRNPPMIPVGRKQ